MSDSNQSPANPPDNKSNSAANQPPAPKRKGKWIKWAIIGTGSVLALAAVGVVLIPSIASTSAVRSAVLGQVNANLNGTVDIDSWSLSWFGPIEIKGIRVRDDQQRTVAEVARIKTDLGLWNAIWGNYDLGQTVIERPNIVTLEVAADGSTNLDRLVKSSPSASSSSPSAAPAGKTQPAASALPAIKGTVTISDFQASVMLASADASAPAQRLVVDPSNFKLDLSDIEKSLGASAKLALRVNDSAPGSITFDAALDAIENGKINPDKLTGNVTLNVVNLDLSGANAALAMAGTGLAAQGIMNGQIQLSAQTAANATVAGQLKTDGFAIGGEGLAGDTYRSSVLLLNLNSNYAASESSGAQWKIDGTEVVTDHAKLALTLAAPESALMAVASGESSATATGSAQVLLSVNDIPGIARQLPGMLALAKDVQISTGSAQAAINLQFAPEQTSLTMTGDVSPITGLRAGRPISSDPIRFSTSANILQGKPGKSAYQDVMSSIVQVAATFDSSFAKVNLQAPTLRTLKGTGNADLSLLSSQLSQFADLGTVQASGKASFDISASQSSGTAPLQTSAVVSLDRLNIRGLQGMGDLAIPALNFNAAASLNPNAAGEFTSLSDARMALSAKDASGRPSIEMQFAANADLAASKGNVQISQFSVPDLAAIQRDFGLFLPEAMRSVQLSGVMGASGEVVYTKELIRTEKDVRFTLSNLSMVQNGKTVLNNEAMAVALSGQVAMNAAGSPAAVDAKAAVEGSIAQINIDSLKLDISQLGTPASREDIALRVAVPDLARVQALMDAVGASDPASPKLAGGAVNVAATLKGNAGNLVFDVPTLQANELSLANGSARWTGNMNLALAGTLTEKAGSADGIEFSKLGGSLAVADLTMLVPIRITGLSGNAPQANGQIRLNGDMAKVSELLAVLQHTPGGTASASAAYKGMFDLTQTLSTSGNQVFLVGGLNVKDLQVVQNGKPVFSEKELLADNDVSVNVQTMDVTIGKLSLETKSSGALTTSVTGAVKGAGTANAIQDKLIADVSYDAAKLLELARPMLDPATQASLAGLNVSGNHKVRYEVSGALPSTMAFNEAVKQLAATGSLELKQLTYSGIVADQISVPFTLSQGVLSLTPTPSNVTANVSGGTASLIGSTIDMTTPVPLLNMPTGLKLLNNVAVSGPLSKDFGKVIPMFGESAVAGSLSITAVQCNRLPLGNLMMLSSDPATGQINDGRAEFLINAPDMKPGGALVEALSLVSSDLSRSLQGGIKDGRVVIERGELSQSVAIVGGGGGGAGDKIRTLLSTDGTIVLSNLSYRNFTVGLPGSLLRGVSSDLAKYVPEVVKLPVGGTVASPKLEGDKVVRQVVQEAVKSAAVQGLLGGNKNEAAPGEQPAKQDPVGSLLGGLLNKDEKKDAAPKQQNAAPAQPKEPQPKKEEPKKEPQPKKDPPKKDQPKKDAPKKEGDKKGEKKKDD